jgi:hypothetical protein
LVANPYRNTVPAFVGGGADDGAGELVVRLTAQDSTVHSLVAGEDVVAVVPFDIAVQV